MKKYKNFDEMFNDNDYVSEEDREIINLEVKLIGKMIEARCCFAHKTQNFFV